MYTTGFRGKPLQNPKAALTGPIKTMLQPQRRIKKYIFTLSHTPSGNENTKLSPSEYKAITLSKNIEKKQSYRQLSKKLSKHNKRKTMKNIRPTSINYTCSI